MQIIKTAILNGTYVNTRTQAVFINKWVVLDIFFFTNNFYNEKGFTRLVKGKMICELKVFFYIIGRLIGATSTRIWAILLSGHSQLRRIAIVTSPAGTKKVKIMR